MRDYTREQEDIAGKPDRIQELGHRVEARWARVLTEWLPPDYEVATRKYILLETDDRKMTKETDIVVFHPHYPKNLRSKKPVLASGIAAAFSVRRTIGRHDIKEAYEEALTLRRGMKIRGGTLRQHLAPPIFFGLLGDSHDWQSPASTPKENMKDITQEFDRDLVKSPREGLDFISIADLGTWTRITTVLTEKYLSDSPAVAPVLLSLAGAVRLEALALSGMRHNYEQQNLAPVTGLIGSLWDKLAINDPTLKPLADGFRITETTDATGSFGMGAGPRKLIDVTSPEVAQSVRAGAWGPEWAWAY